MRISATQKYPIGPNAKKFPGDVQRALAKWAANTLNTMQDYPPQLAHVKYRRTGRYGRNWRAVKSPTQATVSNSTEYAPFLGGDEQVNWAAARGWRQLSEVAEENAEELRASVEDAARSGFGVA